MIDFEYPESGGFVLFKVNYTRADFFGLSFIRHLVAQISTESKWNRKKLDVLSGSLLAQ